MARKDLAPVEEQKRRAIIFFASQSAQELGRQHISNDETVPGHAAYIVSANHFRTLQTKFKPLFPQETGFGATVFYNMADLRFSNPLSGPVLLRLRVEDGWLRGALCTRRDPGFSVEVLEEQHRFFREKGIWYRENRIRRRILRRNGQVLADHVVAHNRGQVRYRPEEAR